MYYMGVTSNIMSLGGIAIAIGAMVDAAIVMIENAHKLLEKEETRGIKIDDATRVEIIIKAAQGVGKPLFFSLLIITVSFLPVFTLEAQEGRLFTPLAFTKTFAMFFASLLSITLAPVLMVFLIRGKIVPEKKNPLNRLLIFLYKPLAHLVLRFRKSAIAAAVALLILTIPAFQKLGTEFMPPLNEGSILYMPTSVPGMSIREAGRILHIQNKVLKTFPEVERVFGKIGRADTSTDPAPLNMVETVLTIKPRDQWREGMTWDNLIDEMDKKLQVPGMPNIWWMPIQTRTEMLATGIRSTIGIKILGSDLETIQKIGIKMEPLLKQINGTRSVFAERVVGGHFIDFEVNRKEAARYGLTVGDVEDIIETAIGGKNIGSTIEGRERYPINVRYARDHRDTIDKLKRVLVPTPSGSHIPMGQVADIKLVSGPPSIRDENGSLAGFVFVDVKNRDLGGYVKEAKAAIEKNITLPSGYRLVWAGQFQYMERAKEKLLYMVPLTLFIVFVLLYLIFESIPKSLIVFLSIPFSIIGGVWILFILDYNLSVAVWVGLIALAGVAAETGVVMIVYLDEVYDQRKKDGRLQNIKDLYEAVMEGAVQRVRPKMMTVLSTIAGLIPIMWSQGTGADVMKRIAAPMIGGMISSTILTLLVIPAIYMMWREKQGHF
jgi:Cu(I)/Ag(I) efflux system membrane protein CusA/SilA